MSDIFHLANRIDAVKKELDIELFLFNKNYTPYHLGFSNELAVQLRLFFVSDLISEVTLGAATGMSVVSVEHYNGDANTIATAPLEEVGRAETLLYLINNERSDIVEFDVVEHDIKRVKGFVLKCTHPTEKDIEFYVVKQMTSSPISGAAAWQIDNTTLVLQQPEATLKAPRGNQVMISGDTVYILDYPKFVNLFNHNIQDDTLLDANIALIERRFKLSYPEGLNMKDIAKRSKKLTQKLLRADPDSITQEALLDQADEYGLALMTDDAGALIIMDSRDALMFANLLNDDYVKSDMTHKRYLTTKKEEVDEADESQLNMNI